MMTIIIIIITPTTLLYINREIQHEELKTQRYLGTEKSEFINVGSYRETLKKEYINEINNYTEIRAESQEQNYSN
jgi:hypothetical protein